MRKKISIVIPSFNEAGNNNLELLKSINVANNNLYYLELSRNFGHQNALKAGYDYADGDCIISMDGDLQHPPELITQFLEKWEEGYDVIYTTREYQDEATYFKTKSSEIFYSMINALSETKLEKGTADFRLIDRKVVDVLNHIKENDIFMRGIIKWLGFKQIGINYQCEARFSGKSKYTLKKISIYSKV